MKNIKRTMTWFCAVAIMVIFATGCTKHDSPTNEGNGENNGNENSSGGHYNGNYEYVDLGLPSGTLWATCNVGAETPEGYGDYFAWGETQPNLYGWWDDYKYWMSDGHTRGLTKYCYKSCGGYNGFYDNLGMLLPEDDAATVNWGNNWRTPTKDEWRELYNNTTRTWTTQNGVAGLLLTNAGNSLFLPTTRRDDMGQYEFGFWLRDLSSQFGSNNYAFVASLSFGYFDDVWSGLCIDDRCYGKSVRAVRSLEKNIQ